MTDVHDFIKCLNAIVDEYFPNTERYLINGSDFVKDFVMELREENKKLRYSPYELFTKSNDYEDTIEQFVMQWKEMLQ